MRLERVGGDVKLRECCYVYPAKGEEQNERSIQRRRN
jgi:hypothetical protein